MLTPKETLAFVWRPHHEHYTAYIGPVCINKESRTSRILDESIDAAHLENAHAFIGTDVEGQMFTAFFDPESFIPFYISYQTQSLVIKPSDWLPRKSNFYDQSEFDVSRCVDPKSGDFLAPDLIQNSEDDPLMFAAHYGFVSG